MLESSEDSDAEVGTLEEPRRRDKEAVFDFSDSEEEEQLESRLKQIEANIRKKHKVCCRQC